MLSSLTSLASTLRFWSPGSDEGNGDSLSYGESTLFRSWVTNSVLFFGTKIDWAPKTLHREGRSH